MAQTQEFRGVESTICLTDDGAIHFEYRGTVVVKLDNDRVWLDSRGWHTYTTKLRMNQASNQCKLGFSVWQKKGDWYVTLPNGDTVAYEDGLTFNVGVCRAQQQLRKD